MKTLLICSADMKAIFPILTAALFLGGGGTGCTYPKASYYPPERTIPAGTNPWYGFNHPWLGVPDVNFPQPLIDEVIDKIGPPPNPKDYHQSPSGKFIWQKRLNVYLDKIRENRWLETWIRDHTI